MGKIIIETNEDFKMDNKLEELIQKLLIKYELEKGLKFIAGITNSNKLKVKVFYKEVEEIDKVFRFKRDLEKTIYNYSSEYDNLTFKLGVGYSDWSRNYYIKRCRRIFW